MGDALAVNGPAWAAAAEAGARRRAGRVRLVAGDFYLTDAVPERRRPSDAAPSPERPPRRRLQAAPAAEEGRAAAAGSAAAAVARAPFSERFPATREPPTSCDACGGALGRELTAYTATAGSTEVWLLEGDEAHPGNGFFCGRCQARLRGGQTLDCAAALGAQAAQRWREPVDWATRLAALGAPNAPRRGQKRPAR
ncbi:unnamed protein product [Prorocentrum cordatum]|uniref:Uncharacterized protein n=1 Tax=Prorocentrum cordatum TaxID=2364126 RepID=A0ABN9T7J3_9DINO|nr:unnamed protein product [Polarella glacialis]